MDFPYEPYEVQRRYMEKVLECLQNVIVAQNRAGHAATPSGRRVHFDVRIVAGKPRRAGVAHGYGENAVLDMFVVGLADGEESRDASQPNVPDHRRQQRVDGRERGGGR